MSLIPLLESAAPESDHRIRLSGGRWLGYSEYGDPDGKPVMSFHGGASCRLDSRFASQFCQERGIRLISVDRPGIGLSDHQPDRTLLDWPEDVARLAQALRIEQFAVLGWSAGGPYALACAYRIPELLTRAGTVGCVAPIDCRPETVRESGLRLDRILYPLVCRSPWAAAQLLRVAGRLPAWVLKRNLLREVVSPGDRALIGASKAAELFDFFYEALRRGPVGTVQDYCVLARPWGFSVEEIAKEVHLWQGDEDRIVPPSQAQWLSERLPNGFLHLVPGQGHFLLRPCLGEVMSVLAGDRGVSTAADLESHHPVPAKAVSSVK